MICKIITLADDVEEVNNAEKQINELLENFDVKYMGQSSGQAGINTLTMYTIITLLLEPKVKNELPNS